MAFVGVVMASFLSWAEFAVKECSRDQVPARFAVMPGTGEVRQEVASSGRRPHRANQRIPGTTSSLMSE